MKGSTKRTKKAATSSVSSWTGRAEKVAPKGALLCFDRLRELAQLKRTIYMVFPCVVPAQNHDLPIQCCDLGEAFEIAKNQQPVGLKVTVGHICYWSEEDVFAFPFGDADYDRDIAFAFAFENYWMAWAYSIRTPKRKKR